MHFVNLALITFLFFNDYAITGLETRRKVRSTSSSKINIVKKWVEVDIELEYCVTKTTVDYLNTDEENGEISFDITIPEGAFITELAILSDEKWYYSHVATKTDAFDEYDDAKDTRRTTSVIFFTKVHQTNGYSISLFLKKNERVSVVWKYEEKLKRSNGTYSLILNQFLTDVVPQFEVAVAIKKNKNVENIKAVAFVESDPDMGETIDIDVSPGDETNIDFELSETQQKNLQKIFQNNIDFYNIGLKLTYDAEKSPESQLNIGGENFIYTLVADDSRSPLPINIAFVLDTSSSMRNERRIDQMKRAMEGILGRLNQHDSFQLIEYGTTVKVWNLDNTSKSVETKRPKDNKSTETSNINLNELPKMYPANKKYIDTAISVVKNLKAKGGTNMYDSLKLGFEILKHELNQNGISLIMFLTDGEATVGLSKDEQVLNMTRENNGADEKIQLHTIGFGLETRKDVLERLAFSNFGSTAYVHDGAGASQNIKNFFNSTSVPVFQNITFSFPTDCTGLVKTSWITLNKGQEAIAAGRCPKGTKRSNEDWKIDVISANGPEVFYPSFIEYDQKERETNKKFEPLQKLNAHLRITELVRDAKIKGVPVSSEVVDLAMKHSIASPSTSLVVVI